MWLIKTLVFGFSYLFLKHPTSHSLLKVVENFTLIKVITRRQSVTSCVVNSKTSKASYCDFEQDQMTVRGERKRSWVITHSSSNYAPSKQPSITLSPYLLISSRGSFFLIRLKVAYRNCRISNDSPKLDSALSLWEDGKKRVTLEGEILTFLAKLPLNRLLGWYYWNTNFQ